MKTRKITTAVLAVLFVFAPGAKAEDPVVFADANLKAAVEAALGVTDPTPTDMLNLTQFNAWQKGITNLTGLEYATNLTNLTMYGNQISNLSPLAGLTKLRELTINRSQISNLQPLSGLTNLTYLELNYNQIADVSPLSGLMNLEVLWLGGANQISDLTPLSRLTSLRELFMDHNQISDLSPLSGLVNLRGLVLYVNQISDLTPLSGLTNLIELGLHVNQISDLSPLCGLTNLQFLRAARNQISDISPLSGLTNLTELELMTNQISDLTPLSALTSLTDLRLWSNQISDLTPLSGLMNLWQLVLTNNPLNPAAYDTYIPMIQANNPEAVILFDPYSPPVYFADGNLKQAVKSALGIGYDPTEAKMATLTQLWANNRAITDLTGIEYGVNLTYLNVRDNQISNLSPLSGLTKLTDLRLQNNQISNISPLLGLTNLTRLWMGPNQISNISPLSGLTKLTSLRLQSNQISDISPLSALTNLTELWLESNQISDISPLSGLTHLGQLWLMNNPLNWDSHFVYIPMIEGNNPGIDLQYDPWVETDSDGITAEVENGAPNGGDENGDAIPDGLQDEVASLPNAVDAGYVTLESPGGTDLVSVSATINPSPGSVPEGVEFPIGFFEFTVQGITPSAAITVTLFTSAEITTYYKYGPTLDAPTDHWYEFLYDGTTGAEILADRVILHLVDGLRGDKDLTANGEIVEPGGPGLLLNTPPLATIIQPSSGFVTAVGTAVDFAGTIDDPDAGDTHTAIWTIGGIDHAGTVSGSSATASVQFSQAGIYSVSLTVTDASSASGTANTVNEMPAYIVIYDPEGGFVTGGGWIDSPQGAYMPDPSLVGKANFGFVSKYKHGATVPTGQTEFVFQAADLNFHSSDYDWLVVTGSDYARFKGTGTINGSGAYKFMLWAGDDDPDTFRIKIWYEEDEVELFTVYDNGMEQPIGGGSIIVHTQ